MSIFFSVRLGEVRRQRPLPPLHELWLTGAARAAHVLPALILVVVVHEAGHTLAALVQRLRVHAVRIGVGPRLLQAGPLQVRAWAWAAGETRVTFRRQWSTALVLVAGPLANVLLMVVALHGVFGAFSPYVAGASLVGVANLLPFVVAGQHSDGRQLLRLVQARSRPAPAARPAPATGGLTPQSVAAALAAAGRGDEAQEVLRHAQP